MEERKQSVKVNIFGEDYPIRGDTDKGYILNIYGNFALFYDCDRILCIKTCMEVLIYE